MAKKQITRSRTLSATPKTVEPTFESDTMNADETNEVNTVNSTDTAVVVETTTASEVEVVATPTEVVEEVVAPEVTAPAVDVVEEQPVVEEVQVSEEIKEEEVVVADVQEPVFDFTSQEAVEATEETAAPVTDSDEVVVGNTEEVMEPVEELTAEEVIQATANPYTESINVVEVNLAPAAPTDESIVESVQAMTQQGIDTPPTPEALTVEARETALAEAHDIVSTEVENLCVNATITLSFLTDFVEAMDITRPITPINAGNQHVRLFNALRSGLENVEENFNIFFGTVLQVVNLHKETVFHPLYASRFIEQAPFRSNSDSRDYLRILDLLRLAADPISRKQVASQIDLTKTLANFSEAARQKVYAFFNI